MKFRHPTIWRLILIFCILAGTILRLTLYNTLLESNFIRDGLQLLSARIAVNLKRGIQRLSIEVKRLTFT